MFWRRVARLAASRSGAIATAWPANWPARDAPVPGLAGRLPHPALRRAADPQLQGGGRRRAGVPRDLPPQPARQHARRTSQRHRGSGRHPGRRRPPRPLRQPQGERRRHPAGRPRRSRLSGATALGRARRLPVPARRPADRRDRGGGRHARSAPDSPGRPLVRVRERRRGQSPGSSYCPICEALFPHRGGLGYSAGQRDIDRSSTAGGSSGRSRSPPSCRPACATRSAPS
jgi:hypothetical protein